MNFQDDAFAVGPPAAPGNGRELVPAAPPAPNSLTAVEQSRAVAEVQAALVVAATRPRAEILAERKIIEACKRVSLAETAIYSYKRGTAQVEGPSIRLAETLARYWGNMTYGFRELSRDRDAAVSEVEAYAWDLETNTKAVRQFQLRLFRDTKQGGYEIKEERDKYELIANMAQRRVRACILEIIPGDIVEAALNQCNLTLAGNEEAPLKDRIKKMVTAFEAVGVSVPMIESKIQHSLDTMTPMEYRQMVKIGAAIRDGYTTIEAAFDTGPQTKAEQPAPGAPAKKPQEAKPEKKASEDPAAKPAQEQAQTPPAEATTAKPDISRPTLTAVEKELSRLGAPGQLPPDLAAEFGTGDPSELSEPQGQKALATLKAMKI